VSANTYVLNTSDDIQTVIDLAANSGDTIILNPGTYSQKINTSGKAITIRSTDPEDLTIVTTTILDGGASGSVITCNQGEGSDTVISGFVIRNGKANFGGGMYNDNSSPTVSSCTFSGNKANFLGGGMSNWNLASPTVINCSFSGNIAGYAGDDGEGGGMSNFDSSPTVTACTFSNNDAEFSGGGMYNNYNSLPTVTDCTFSGNTAYNYGGGMSNVSSSSSIITGCTFSDNDVEFYGGGMYNASSASPEVSNCRFSGNSATYGGGIRNDSSPLISDSSFCNNTPNAIEGSYADIGGNNLAYCSPRQATQSVAACIAGDIDASGEVDLVDFAIIADPMNAILIMAENWLAGTL